MKRVKAACIIQTLHFLLKEDVSHSYAVKFVNEEVKKYKEQLEKIVRSIRFLLCLNFFIIHKRLYKCIKNHLGYTF